MLGPSHDLHIFSACTLDALLLLENLYYDKSVFSSAITAVLSLKLDLSTLLQDNRAFLFLHKSWTGGIVLSVQYAE